MTQLDRDLAHIKHNLKRWACLYDEESLARTKRLVSYMEELRHHRKGETEDTSQQ